MWSVPAYVVACLVVMQEVAAVQLCHHLEASHVEACVAQYRPLAADMESVIGPAINAEPGLIPLLSRLAWHSAGTYNRRLKPIGGTNGGCIRMPPESVDAGNANVAPALDLVISVRHRHNWATLADCIQLASAVAHEFVGCTELGFTPGRQDFHVHESEEKCSANGRLPSKEVIGDVHPLPRTQSLLFEKFAVFLDSLDTTPDANGIYTAQFVEEAVALMGGHTLGGMHRGTSGNEGNFTKTPFVFDNEYFVNLVELDWSVEAQVGGKVGDATDLQYERGGIALLPVDVAMVHNPQMLPFVQRFADNNSYFMEVYARAWDRLAENGLDRSSGGVTPYPTATPSQSCTPSTLSTPDTNTPYTCQIELPVAGMALHYLSEAESVSIAISSEGGSGWMGVSFPQSQGTMLAPHALIWANGELGHYGIVSRSLDGFVAKPSGNAEEVGLLNTAYGVVNGRQVVSFTLSCGGRNSSEACAFDAENAYINVARDGTSNTLIQHSGLNKGSAVINLLTGVSRSVSDDIMYWRKLHGSLMSAATLFVIPLGIFAKRYGKHVFGVSDSSRLPLGPAFIVHVCCMVVALSMVVTAASIALTKLDGTGSAGDAYNHRVIGFVCMVVLCVVCTAGMAGRFLPPKRKIPRRAHAVLGAFMLILMCIQTVTGVKKLRAYDPTQDEPFVILLSAGYMFMGGTGLLLELVLAFGKRTNTSYVEAAFMGSVTYSRLEVQKHNTKEDAWIVMEGKVYNVQGWPQSHPGGEDIIYSMAGKDATERFYAVNHSSAAQKKMKEYFIGMVEGTDVSSCIELVGDVATCLVELDIDKAERILSDLEGGELPKSLILEFRQLLNNLDAFKPYLPDSLLETLCTNKVEREYSEAQDPFARELEANPPDHCVIAFTDVQSSTNLWESTPAGMRSALQEHNDVIRSVIRRCRGYEVKTIGDAFMVAFTSATDALEFGLSVQDELVHADWHPALLEQPLCREARNLKTGQPIWGGLRVRIGMHIGPVDAELNPVTGRLDFFGSTVNKAARVESKSVGGALCVTEEMLVAVEGTEALKRVERVPVGLVQLKGVKEKAKLCVLLPESLAARKTDIVGVLMSAQNPGLSSNMEGSLVTDPRTPTATDIVQVHAVLHNSIATAVGVSLNLRRLPVSLLAGTASKLVATVMEAVQRTSGVFQSLCGSSVLATWNVGKRCREHVVQSTRFASIVTTAPIQSKSGDECMLSEALVSTGISTGLCKQGRVGRRNQKSIMVIGSPVDLALRLAAHASELNSRCLACGTPGHHCVVEDKMISRLCRVADVWRTSHTRDSEANFIVISELNTAVLSMLMTTTGFAEQDDSETGLWGNVAALTTLISDPADKAVYLKEYARMYAGEADRVLCTGCKMDVASLSCAACNASACRECVGILPGCSSHEVLPDNSSGSLGVLEHMSVLLGADALRPSKVFHFPTEPVEFTPHSPALLTPAVAPGMANSCMSSTPSNPLNMPISPVTPAGPQQQARSFRSAAGLGFP